MNILIIKQTSLGDVLHSTGHVRAIKKQYPHSKITLLTATTSTAIYQHNPWVDEIIQIDRYGVKKNWFKHPVWAWKEMAGVMKKIRQKQFDLAIDLQGLAKSVVFLYGAKSSRKFVKGNWIGLKGYRNKALHAIKEMDQVVALAGISIVDTSMEFALGDQEKLTIDNLLAQINQINQSNKPILLLSPFSRWPSKDWPLENYLSICKEFAGRYKILITGSEDRKVDIDHGIAAFGLSESQNDIVNMAGRLTLPEFAALVGRVSLMVTGDSFPMHVAGAMKTPVIALFGPTDEKKVGPLCGRAKVIRVSDCDICDRANCPRQCLAQLSNEEVLAAVEAFNQ